MRILKLVTDFLHCSSTISNSHGKKGALEMCLAVFLVFVYRKRINALSSFLNFEFICHCNRWQSCCWHWDKSFPNVGILEVFCLTVCQSLHRLFYMCDRQLNLIYLNLLLQACYSFLLELHGKSLGCLVVFHSLKLLGSH